jgi:hypothetical protein
MTLVLVSILGLITDYVNAIVSYHAPSLMVFTWKPLRILALVALVLITSKPALADLMPLNGAAVAPNIAEVTVREDGVYVSLEVYIGDLTTFRALLPNEFLKSDTSTRASLDERLQVFSAEGLQVLADGNRLTAELLLGEPRRRVDRSAALAAARNPLSQLPTPEPPKDDRVFYAELRYPFETRPDSLVIAPPTKPNGAVGVSIGFIVFHETVPVIDFRYLSAPATLRLDWGDVWYSRFDNKNLKRHHASALMTFLYVESREVRHETLIRVRDLESWTDLAIAENEGLENKTQTRIKQIAQDFFKTKNPVKIDGVPVKATSSRAEFLTVSTSGLQVVKEGDAIDLPNAILGIILSFPVPALPQSVTIDWELFNERQQTVQATATDPAGPFLNLLSPDAPRFKWSNYLRTYKDPLVKEVEIPVGNTFPIPVLSIGLALASVVAAGLALDRRGIKRVGVVGIAGVGLIAGALSTSSAVIDIRNPFDRLPDAETSSRIFAAVLENVNTANLETAPESRQQQLGAVVSAGAMNEVARELDRALAIQVAGGGLARVDAVEDLVMQEIRPSQSGAGFEALASWTAQANAGHWGHNHKRTVSYRALVELREEAGAWKLTGITVVDTKQLN